MGHDIRVRQSEMIIVLDDTGRSFVTSLFTTGMQPCIGLALWHPTFCGLAHVDGTDSAMAIEPVLERFAEIVAADKKPSQAQASIIVTQKSESKDSIRSKEPKDILKKSCRDKNIDVKVIREAKPDVSSIISIDVKSGVKNYNFDVNTKGSTIPRENSGERWVQALAFNTFRFGIYSRSAEQEMLKYVKSTNVDELKKAIR